MPKFDKIRHNRARALIHNERDALLREHDRRMLDPENFEFSKAAKNRARAILISILLALGAMIPFAIVMVVWFADMHDSADAIIATIVLLLIAACLIQALSLERVTGKDRLWLNWLGRLCMLTIVVAAVSGWLMYFQHLVYYWKLQDMRVYTDVAASQSSAAFGDGSLFLWSDDTRLDSLRSVGFKSRFSGNTYCVAPVVDSTSSATGAINFYAVGENCCSPRASFRCDDARDVTARSGVAVLTPEDVSGSLVNWILRGPVTSQYTPAIKLQAATFNNQVAPEPKLVRWVKDPLAAKDKYWNDSVQFAIVSGAVTFAILLVVGFFAGWQMVTKKAPYISTLMIDQ